MDRLVRKRRKTLSSVPTPEVGSQKRGKPRLVKFLQWFYLGLFVAVLAVPTVFHNTSVSFLEVLRLPTFFEATQEVTGVNFVRSMTVYHFVFAYFLLIILIDAVSLFWYSNVFLRQLSFLSSFIGLFVIGLMVIYFFVSFSVIGFSNYSVGLSAFVFLLLSLMFFILDLLTLYVDEESLYFQRFSLHK
jgi:hypothetical protein